MPATPSLCRRSEPRRPGNDRLRELAIERAIEIVGEAAKNVSAEYKAEHPQIPWKDITRTRDFFAHAYFKMNMDAVWEIVTVSLPELIAELEKVLERDSRAPERCVTKGLA